MRYAIALFIVFLTLSVGALEYSATTKPATMQLCSCGTYSNVVEVANLDTKAAEFLVTNPSPAWVQTTPNKLILQPQRKTSVTNILTVPCGLAGEFELRNRIYAGSTQKELLQKVTVQKCPNTQVALPSEALSACACDPQEIVVEISNIGSFTEEYVLNASPYAVQYSENPIVLLPKQKKNVTFVLDVPCAALGEQTLNLVFYAKRNDVLSKVPVQIAVSSCGTLSLQAKDFSVCSGVPTQLNVPFTYDGKPAQISLEADVSWIQPVTFSSSKQARLELLAPVSGTFDVHLFAKRQNTTLAQSRLTIDSSSCYQLLMQAEPMYVCGTSDAAVTLRNSGTKSLDLTLRTDGPAWIDVSTKRLTLSANGTTTASIRMSSTDVSPGTYTTVLHADSSEGYSTNATLTIHVPTQEGCSLIDMSPATELVTSGHKQLPLLIENKGFVREHYRFSLDGSNWLRLFPETLTLGPNEQGVLYLETSPSADIMRGEYRFQIHATTSQNIQFSKTFLIDLKEDSKILWPWIMGAVVVIVLLMYFVVRRRSIVSIELVREEEQALRHPILSWLCVSVSALLLVIGAYVAYRKTALTQGIVGIYVFGYLLFVIAVVVILALLIWYMESPPRTLPTPQKEAKVKSEKTAYEPKEEVESWKEEGLLSPATNASSVVNNFDVLEKKESRRREKNKRKHAAKEKPYTEKVREHEKKRQK